MRRVDRLAFLDLTTVHRTITLSIYLDGLKAVAGQVPELLPVALYRRGAGRAGMGVVDAEGRRLRYLTGEHSDDAIGAQIKKLWTAAGLPKETLALEQVRRHRAWSCELLRDDARGFDGYADLAAEKWGCPQVGRLLCHLRANGERGRATDALRRLLFDWQNNNYLLLPVYGKVPDSWSTLTISYDEQLLDWQTPAERRRGALGGNAEDQGRVSRRKFARGVSRGGPFKADLDALAPGFGRRLGRGWHISWEQTVLGEVGSHHIEIEVPAELAVVRMRMLVSGHDKPILADQVGRRGHLMAPPTPTQSPGPPPRSLLSLVVAHRDPSLWWSGAVLAFVTALSLLLGAVFEMERVVEEREAATTTLVLAPTLVGSLLSLRATSDLADILVRDLRRLLGAVAVLALVAALVLIVAPSPPPSPEPEDGGWVRVVWICLGVALVVCSALLLDGAYCATALSRAIRREQPRDVPSSPEDRLGTRFAPATPPPDSWIESGEGDRVPWGWKRGAFEDDPDLREDRRYWSAVLSGSSQPGAEGLTREQKEQIRALIDWAACPSAPSSRRPT